MTLSAQLSVASIQMVSSPSWEDNLNSASTLISAAKSAGATLIALPEYFCLMGHTDQDKVKICEKFGDGPIQHALKNLATQHQIYLVAGTIPIASTNIHKVKNSTLVFNPSGDVISRYDKIHLFGFQQDHESYQESNTIEAGNVPTSFTIHHQNTEWRLGLSICMTMICAFVPSPMIKGFSLPMLATKPGSSSRSIDQSTFPEFPEIAIKEPQLVL